MMVLGLIGLLRIALEMLLSISRVESIVDTEDDNYELEDWLVLREALSLNQSWGVKMSCPANILRITTNPLDMADDLARLGVSVYSPPYSSRKHRDVETFFQPQLAEFLCRNGEARDWHKRYGNVTDFDCLCKATVSELVTMPGESKAQKQQDAWKKESSRASFSLAKPSHDYDWLVLHIADGAVIQHEGAILLSSGVLLQGKDCCYCEAQLNFRNLEKACACVTKSEDCSGFVESADEVFSIAQVFGYGYAHFVKEILPRIVPFLDKLVNTPSIKIHIKTLHDAPPAPFIEEYLRLLGISPTRLVRGDILAKTVWAPLWTACGMSSLQYKPLWATREVMWDVSEETSSLVTNDAESTEDDSPGATDPVIIVIERRQGLRTWLDKPSRYDDVFKAVQQAVPADYPQKVIRVSDDDEALMQCIACQVRLFRRADAVIGIHGAGLSNALFMQPGGLVVELGWDEQQTEYTVLSHVAGHRYVLYDTSNVLNDRWRDLTDIVQKHLISL